MINKKLNERDYIKTIALIGSPRKNGNCDQLVSKLLDNIEGFTKNST